jgi:16S rRNA (cytosine1402-N4)-methyltransferase
LPVCGCGAKEVVEILTSRPVTASEEEVQRNPRSRSAKLRVAEKLLAVSS